MARKIFIETSECVSCGSCESVCPDVFRVDEENGYAEVIDPDGASEDEIQEAMDYCPTSCIHWEE